MWRKREELREIEITERRTMTVAYGEVFTVVPKARRGPVVEGGWAATSLGWEERLQVCSEWVVAVRRCFVEGRRGWLASCGIVVFSGLRQCGFQNLGGCCSVQQALMRGREGAGGLEEMVAT